MDKLKRYFKYVLLFILTYIIVTLLTNFGMRETKEDFKCNVIKNESYTIEVEESKSSNHGGRIYIKVTNKTEEIQTDKY